MISAPDALARALQPWADTECVRRLDDRLYGWQTTLSALRR